MQKCEALDWFQDSPALSQAEVYAESLPADSFGETLTMVWVPNAGELNFHSSY